MKKIYSILFGCCLTIGIISCSTQKNTGASRAWHELKVIHNIQFNGEQSYKEGIEAINQAHEDNFALTLPLYPVSDHRAAESAASSMDKAIDKCRKSIKLHSIKSRPKINPKKRNDAKYQNWLKSKEFNSQMYRAWLMLGQSEFHKGDFLGAVGTFRYIEKMYEDDPNLSALSQLWVARSYGELGWIYEAEDVLSKVKVENLKRKNEPFYSAVSADILLKGDHHKDAIPFVKAAKANEKRKEYLPRFEYVLGQLYQENKQNAEARNAYKRVFRLHPKDVKMEFNARLHYAELKGDTLKTMKQLRQLARLYKYRDDLDLLYGTMGNIYLANGDTARALEHYEKGIELSTKAADAKARILIVAGDLYYDRHNYSNASPCYKEASQIIISDHPDYKRVQHRSEVLDEVVVETETIALQDSLQHLGTLSEEEQLAVVEKLIADLKEKELQDSIRQAEEERQAELDAESGGLQSVNTSMMLGSRMGENANWYFYNPQLMRSGKQEFMRKWGKRVLEDNWRRLSKATMSNASFDTSSDEMEENMPLDSVALSADSTLEEEVPVVTDIYSPEYYLQQIPKTEEDYAASNAQIADALYNLVFIYRDKVGDTDMSYQSWQEFCRRFPNDERMVDLYYDQYLNALRTNDTTSAMYCRGQILSLYPTSAQAKIVSDPAYFESLKRMAIEQDSLYAATYDAYTHNRFAEVKANKIYAESNYPLTPLMPHLCFLNSIAVAKTDGQVAFIGCLQDMVERYPEHELSAMAKDMLAMMGQGMESKKGGTTSTLTDQRQTQNDIEDNADKSASLSTERREASTVYIVIANDETQLNNLLYEVAVYNFSQFLIKDFDLKKIAAYTLSNSALEIAGFDSMDEAEWYISLLQENTGLSILFKELNALIFPVTETNAPMLNKSFTLDEYILFYQQHSR